MEKQAKITNSTFHPGGKKNTERETEPAELQPPVRNTSSSAASSFSFIFRAHCLAPWLLDAFVIYTLECFSCTFLAPCVSHALTSAPHKLHSAYSVSTCPHLQNNHSFIFQQRGRQETGIQTDERDVKYSEPTDFSSCGAIRRSVLI